MKDTFHNVRADSRLLYVQISLQIGVQTNVQTQVQTNGRTELGAPGTKLDVKIQSLLAWSLDKYILQFEKI